VQAALQHELWLSPSIGLELSAAVGYDHLLADQPTDPMISPRRRPASRAYASARVATQLQASDNVAFEGKLEAIGREAFTDGVDDSFISYVTYGLRIVGSITGHLDLTLGAETIPAGRAAHMFSIGLVARGWP